MSKEEGERGNRYGKNEFKTQKDLTDFIKIIVDSMSSSVKGVENYKDGLATLLKGCSDPSLVGDYPGADRFIMNLPRTRSVGGVKIHDYGSSRLEWSSKNTRAVSAMQVFEEQVNVLRAARISTLNLGENLSEVEIAQFKATCRGDPTRRALIITQYNLLIQLIILRIDEAYWEELIASSAIMAWGVANGCLLSVLEGWRNQIANPKGSVNPNIAERNRRAAEEVLEKIELPIEIQLKVFELKRTLGTIIENIRRTTSILTDSAIIRLILPKLEQDFIFINIDRTWDIEQRFRNCNDLELFWKILEQEVYTFTESVKGKSKMREWNILEQESDDLQVNTIQRSSKLRPSSSSSSLSSSSPPNSSLGRSTICTKFLNEGQCSFGDSCKFRHLIDVKAAGQGGGVSQKDREAFDRSRKRHVNNSKEQALSVFKQLKAESASGGGASKSKMHVNLMDAELSEAETDEFALFFAEREQEN
jgi:hypothetical protein